MDGKLTADQASKIFGHSGKEFADHINQGFHEDLQGTKNVRTWILMTMCCLITVQMNTVMVNNNAYKNVPVVPQWHQDK